MSLCLFLWSHRPFAAVGADDTFDIDHVLLNAAVAGTVIDLNLEYPMRE